VNKDIEKKKLFLSSATQSIIISKIKEKNLKKE